MMNKKKTQAASYSDEHKKFLKEIKKKRILIRTSQIMILFFILGLWQVFSSTGVIDSFIASSPIKFFSTIIQLFVSGEIYAHLFTTLYETLLGFAIGTALGILIAIFLWRSETAQKILDPYLVVANALPKIALGPLIIVWAGAGIQSILIMTLLISVIVATISIYSSFKSVDESQIMMLKTFGATKTQILTKLVLPSSIEGIIDAAKINVGMSLVGVIMGEFLVSKKGLGYLILYGSQVFNLDLVMAGIIILAILSAAMYFGVEFFEKKIKQKLF